MDWTFDGSPLEGGVSHGYPGSRCSHLVAFVRPNTVQCRRDPRFGHSFAVLLAEWELGLRVRPAISGSLMGPCLTLCRSTRRREPSPPDLLAHSDVAARGRTASATHDSPVICPRITS